MTNGHFRTWTICGLALCLACLCVVPSFCAVPVELDEGMDTETDNIPSGSMRNISLSDWVLLPGASAVDPTLISESPTFTSSDGLKGLLLQLLGSYQSAIISVSSSEGTVYTLAGLDIPWIASALCFLVLLYSFFRLLGGWLCRL